MTDDRHDRAEEIFQDALDRPESERESFIAQACGTDDALRAEVESLLAHFAAAGSRFLSNLGDSLSATRPEHVGPFRVLRLLGEGGMGSVWLAEQEEPIARQVALKVMRWVFADPELTRRFVEERRFLAQMRHPNVAQIFDAGTADDGSPYIVMEFIEGARITTYCDDLRLDVRERLELFLAVCAGVMHAHQRGVIHRDLKPSNILVATTEGTSTPKIIDFGIAKSLEAGGTMTQEGQVLGTPEYMSPEQIASGSVDTRSDVYALGVVLYQLLSGRLPFADTPGERPALEYWKRASTGDAPRPSDRVSSTSDATSAVAALRREDERSLSRVLRGDLDWILLKALARNPTDRYQSVNDLAEDLRRHLRCEPITARPPTMFYLMGRFVERHPGRSTAIAVGILGLLALTATSAWYTQRLVEEREAAKQQASIAQAISEFLNDDLLAAVAPEKQGPDVKVRDILDAAGEQVEERFADDRPTLRAIHRTLATAYARLGEFDAGIRHAERAVEVAREVWGNSHAETGAALNDLGAVTALNGDLERGASLLEEALPILQRTRGPAEEITLSCQRQLANVYEWQEHIPEADSLYADALVKARRSLGADHLETITLMNDLGLRLADHGDRSEGEALLADALAAYRRTEGDASANALVVASNLAWLAYANEDYERAVERYEGLVDEYRKAFGDEHVKTCAVKANLAAAYRKVDRNDDALPLLESVVEIDERTLGSEHPKTLTHLNVLAGCYLDANRLDLARDTAERVVDARRHVFGPDHSRTLGSVARLAGIYEALGRTEDALTAWSEVIARSETLETSNPSLLVSTLTRRGDLLRREERWTSAEAELLDAFALCEREARVGTTDRETAVEALVQLYESWNRPDEAAVWRERAADLEKGTN